MLDPDGLDHDAPFGPTPREVARQQALELERPGMIVRGVGPVPADGMGVGEAPGGQEHVSGRPFVGKAGGVLTAYLRAVGIPRGEIFLTNLYPFWPGQGNPDPTEEQIRGAEHHLATDLARVQPRVVAAIGRIATRWFLGDVDMDLVHGIPHHSPRTPAVVVPCYHPAAGFYDPGKAADSQQDFLQFAYYLKNPVKLRLVPKIRVVLHDTAPRVIRDAAIDTEGLEGEGAAGPWGLSWSIDGRTAHVWLYAPGKRPPKLAGFILFHNALHDLKILRAMRISTAGLRYGDTMVKLFDLQLEPQGLKAAAYRHRGLKMSSFDEVTRPSFNEAAIAWLREAAAGEYSKPEPMPITDYKQRRWRLYKPQSVGRRMKNAITAFEKEQAGRAAGVIPDKPIKLEKRWAEIGLTDWVDLTTESQAAATAAVGRPFPEFSLHIVPKRKATIYSGTDAAATMLIDGPVTDMLDSRGLAAVYEMDRRALPFVDRMQEVGMRVDPDKLAELEADLAATREAKAKRVRSIVGDRWFNPGSGDQVAAWLYSYKGLPILKETDTGRGSTSDAALQMLRGYHAQDEDVAAFLTGVQDYREADKILGTFIRPMFADMRRDDVGDWRLHWDFRITRVVSGRLSGRLLTIPVRTPAGKRLRNCFVARAGFVIVDADLSQLELRIGAHYSKDRRMRDAFESGEDLHALTASIIFKVLLSAIGKDSAQRYVAKTINFAVFYGITARALLEQLYQAGVFDYTLEDCERFIREWFKIYGSVRDFQRRLWEQAAKDGFVRTLWGRICYVPNLRVMDEKLMEAARRLAANFPVQGSGSDTTKRAEIRVHDWIEDAGLRDEVRPWLQMHDELVLEVREGLAGEVRKMLGAAMVADQRMFSVPIKAEAKVGASWGEAKG